jgi:heme exporter protein C
VRRLFSTSLATPLLWAALSVGMAAALRAVFLVAPTERVMGEVQRIFYFHFPAAAGCFLAFAVVAAASVGYLWSRDLRWDRLARASAEVGMLFCTIVLVTGPIWARPAWGVWWTWEARLTTTLVLWLLYAAYLMVGLYTESREQQARACAVVGIVAFLDVPVVYYSVQWWRGHHPIVFGRLAGGGLAPEMWPVVWLCMGVFLALYVTLVRLRSSIAETEDSLTEIEQRLWSHKQ